jgi:hypothetical protein
MQSSTDLENILYKNVITHLEDFLFDKYKVNWQNRIAYKGQYNKTCFSSSI